MSFVMVAKIERGGHALFLSVRFNKDIQFGVLSSE